MTDGWMDPEACRQALARVGLAHLARIGDVLYVADVTGNRRLHFRDEHRTTGYGPSPMAAARQALWSLGDGLSNHQHDLLERGLPVLEEEHQAEVEGLASAADELDRLDHPECVRVRRTYMMLPSGKIGYEPQEQMFRASWYWPGGLDRQWSTCVRGSHETSPLLAARRALQAMSERLRGVPQDTLLVDQKRRQIDNLVHGTAAAWERLTDNDETPWGTW